jgi:hypothetical protein
MNNKKEIKKINRDILLNIENNVHLDVIKKEKMLQKTPGALRVRGSTVVVRACTSFV